MLTDKFLTWYVKQGAFLDPFLYFILELFNTASDSPVSKHADCMLRFWHWQSDALAFRSHSLLVYYNVHELVYLLGTK
jgi:hypothetical protein